MNLRGYQLMVALAIACLVVGSGAFSSVGADRGLSVGVADDENAYLGYSSGGPLVLNASNGSSSTETLATVTDNIDAGFQLDVNPTGSSLAFATVENVSAEPSNDDWEITADINCTDVGDGDLSFTVVALGDGTSVEMERSVTVDCEAFD